MGAPKIEEFISRFRVTDGARFRLKDHDPASKGGLPFGKDEASALLQAGVKRLSELQEMLYAQDKWAILLIFQAMDAAGKDSAIKHVMSGVNPTGCHVTSFKQPSNEELDHDYLWRSNRAMPQRGMIGIHNRSYYEEVLVVRVHPEYLKGQKLPAKLVGKDIWQRRYEDIRNHERYLSNNGIVIRKFFLNVSREEQKLRFLERLEHPEKNWKFQASDVAERQHWDKYMEAYEAAIRATATEHAPWYVIPADRKWLTRLAVAAVVIDTLEGLGLAYPEVEAHHRAEFAKAKALLEKE